jgi:diphthine synthase
MGKLTFAGLGLGGRGISLESIEAIKESDISYLEYYTSPHEPALLRELSKTTGKELVIVDRAFVEDGRRILEDASKKKVVLTVQGDPMIATTHTELRVRAIKQGIETAVIHAAAVVSAAASESGLHYYKFGRVVTYTVDDVGFHRQVYKTIHLNLQYGLHTLLLLEFDVERGGGVDPSMAMKGLMAAEANFKRAVIDESTFIIVISRIGAGDFQIRAGALGKLSGVDFGSPPHCIIVSGSMHFTEVESVSAICGIPEKVVKDNAAKIKRTAQVLVPKYVEKTRKALAKARESLGESYTNLLENVELYMKDAETHLSNEEDELAMLSIGYAEGLLDSLTYTDKLRLEW